MLVVTADGFRMMRIGGVSGHGLLYVTTDCMQDTAKEQNVDQGAWHDGTE